MIIRAIADTRGLKMVLLDLATVVLARSEPGEAAPLFRESLRLSLAQVPRPDTWLTAVEGLARAALDTGQPARAARLLGAAEALWRLERLARHPDRQPLFDAAVTGARAALGEEAFATAWAEGQALTLDEAVEEALAGAEHGPKDEFMAARPPPAGMTDSPKNVLHGDSPGMLHSPGRA